VERRETFTRTTFEMSRAAEYFTARELQAQTGQSENRFAAVVLKELLDNGADACEQEGIAPRLALLIDERDTESSTCIL
jgi:DNA topoisomerase VI subunit B